MENVTTLLFLPHHFLKNSLQDQSSKRCNKALRQSQNLKSYSLNLIKVSQIFLANFSLGKHGFIQIEAFFQMLDLHGISLVAEDKFKLKQLCETRQSQIKFKDALALIQVNRNLKEDGTPAKANEAMWCLQIPQRKDRSSRASQSVSPLRADDTRSNYSGYTNYTDVSIDPAIRAKAEQILRDEVGERLDTINEDEEVGQTKKLTKDVLSTLDGGKASETRSVVPSQLRSKRASIDGGPRKKEALSKFEDSSNIDQDDSYGNYRPAFLIKKHKVSGRTEEIMKLQRMASLDNSNAMLKPLHPDLSHEQPRNRRMYPDSDIYKKIDHIGHDEVHADGSPCHFYRKAQD